MNQWVHLDGRLTMEQETISDDGFGFSMKFDCTTADTSLAADERLIIKSLRRTRFTTIKKGTSDAEQVTLSFHVKSNLTATYTI